MEKFEIQLSLTFYQYLHTSSVFMLLNGNIKVKNK